MALNHTHVMRNFVLADWAIADLFLTVRNETL